MEENIMFWNPWWIDSNYDFKLNQREVFSSFKKYLNRKEVIFFTGVRRAGKTSSIYYLIKELLASGKNPKNILYLNMDDEVFSNSTLNDIYEYYKKLTLDIKGKKYIFLDEVQSLDGWEKWIKKMYDSFEDLKFVISGSKSYLLKKESTLLTGRMLELEIYPLSFREYLNFNKIEFNDQFFYIKNKPVIKNELYKYIKFGGFPEPVLEENEHLKALLCKEYYDNIKNKDIIIYFHIKESKKFDRLSMFLVSNIGKQYSANKLGRVVDLSPTIVNNYIDYSEMMYLFLPLQHFNYSLKGQMTKPRKIYSIDTGMVNSIAFQFSENIGRYIENIVYLELKRKGDEVYYYNDKHECDFIIKKGLKIVEAIQVCYKLTEDNLKREEKGLLEAMKKFNLDKGTILILEGNNISSNENIEVVSLVDWLLKK